MWNALVCVRKMVKGIMRGMSGVQRTHLIESNAGKKNDPISSSALDYILIHPAIYLAAKKNDTGSGDA